MNFSHKVVPASLWIPSTTDRRNKRGVVWPSDLDNINKGPDGLTDYCRFNGILNIGECHKTRKHIQYESFPLDFFDSSNTALRVGVFVYTLIAVACLLLSLFFSIVLTLGWRTHFTFPIYRIILQLSISYLLLSISQFFTNIPMYLFKYYQPANFNLIPFFVEQTVSYAAILFYSLLTANRFFVFTVTRLKELFSSTNVYISIVLCWLLATLSSAFMIFYGCVRRFDGQLFLYVDECRPKSSAMFQIYQIIFFSFYILPLLNLLMYCAIGLSIFLQRTGSAVSIGKTEIDLLKQSVAIFVIYMIAITITLIQPFIVFESYATVYIATMLIGVMDPLLGVIFVGTFIGSNRTVRKAIREKMPKQIAGRFFGHSRVEPGQLFVRSPTHTHEDH